MPAIEINANVTRKPSFGWGNSDDLRKFLEHYREKHNPLIWSVPQQAVPSGEMGLFQRPAELNFCVIEDDPALLNEIRLNPDRSYEKVLLPMWEDLLYRFNLSSITMVEELPSIELIPNYKLGDAYEGQYIWDVMKVSFTAIYSQGPPGL